MLSVLIPVYQVDVRNLTQELLLQCRKLGIAFEIRCLDDGSSDEVRQLNRTVTAFGSEVIYEELTTNQGRSKIRNELVDRAAFEWLWFLDCDGDARQNPDLASNFWKLKKNNTLLSGGRIYQSEAPADPQLFLHWLWGSQRELLDPVTRMKDPVNAFLSNNFLIRKELFLKVRFDDSLNGYGYEDTLLASELVYEGVEIVHVVNPVVHDGLEPAPRFLKKIEESLENLLKLQAICRQKEIGFPVKSKLIQATKILRKPLIKQLATLYFKRNLASWKNALLGPQPDLRTFDLYRLGYLLSRINERQR